VSCPFGWTNTRTRSGMDNSRLKLPPAGGTRLLRRRCGTIGKAEPRRFETPHRAGVLGGLWLARPGDAEGGESCFRTREERSTAPPVSGSRRPAGTGPRGSDAPIGPSRLRQRTAWCGSGLASTIRTNAGWVDGRCLAADCPRDSSAGVLCHNGLGFETGVPTLELLEAAFAVLGRRLLIGVEKAA
jgi:hypothetical protein